MNRIYIEPTKFTNLRDGEEYFGWRAFDDYAQAYDNTWEKADIPDDDISFLIRKLGGAIYGDRRYGRVFVGHNGAESYYQGRGFRGALKV